MMDSEDSGLEDMGSDDYYVLEADLSSSGGYINFMTVSVPIGSLL